MSRKTDEEDEECPGGASFSHLSTGIHVFLYQGITRLLEPDLRFRLASGFLWKESSVVRKELPVV